MYLLIICIISAIIAMAITIYNDEGEGNLIYYRVCLFFSVAGIATYFLSWSIIWGIMKYDNKVFEYKEIYIESVNSKDNFSIDEHTDWFSLNAKFENGIKKIKISPYYTIIKKENDVKPHIKNYFYRMVFPPLKTNLIFDREMEPGEWFVNDYDETEDDYDETEDLILVIPTYTTFNNFKK